MFFRDDLEAVYINNKRRDHGKCRYVRQKCGPPKQNQCETQVHWIPRVLVDPRNNQRGSRTGLHWIDCCFRPPERNDPGKACECADHRQTHRQNGFRGKEKVQTRSRRRTDPHERGRDEGKRNRRQFQRKPRLTVRPFRPIQVSWIQNAIRVPCLPNRCRPGWLSPYGIRQAAG
jgi:hypothetical protein